MIYSVYGLTDPRRDAKVFYVGFSTEVGKRRTHHGRNKSGYAYPVCREIVKAGLLVGVKIFVEIEDRIEAKRLERELILTLDGLVNSKDPKCMLSLLLYPR